ncbi:MAG: hypothetical protein FWC03_05040, partial [Treponema sp.]|nr:hypothetical protein [Treponema sp.]
MKKAILLLVIFFTLLSLYGQSRVSVSLDDAINNAALQIQDSLEASSTIIVFQFQSHSVKASEFVLMELFDKLVNLKKFTVLDRGAQQVINAEL